MDFILVFPTTVTASIVALLLFCYYSKRSHQNKAKVRVAPEASGGWPLIGHILMLGGAQPPHITLASMADKYGSIFSIRLGVYRSLVVSSSELAKECFTTNDRILSARPKTLGAELMGYNYAMFGFGPYGQYWRDMRKTTTLHLLSNHQTLIHRPIRESEVKSSIKEIYDLWVKTKKTTSHEVQIEMKSWFKCVTLNVILRIVLGKERQETQVFSTECDRDPWIKALREFFELMGVFTVTDLVPMLRWLDLGGYEKAMKKTAKEMDLVLSDWLEKHKRRKKSRQQKDKDIMDVLLSILDDSSTAFGYDADTINKSICLTLILGGTDTTTVTLTWALSLLLNNRHAMRKAQEELDLHVGRERQVKESDLDNLVYIHAIIKETFRLYPAAQLSPPREAMEDCTLGGYHVQAGTRLFLNLWKIHRDPELWPDPLEFKPERFLTTKKDVDVMGKHFELLPFGSGRRMCPGINFAVQVSFLTLASLLHGFELTTPADEPVDTIESFGFTNTKATALDVMLAPRLSRHLYQ